MPAAVAVVVALARTRQGRRAPTHRSSKRGDCGRGVTRFFAPDANVEAHVGGPFQIYMGPFVPCFASRWRSSRTDVIATAVMSQGRRQAVKPT